MPPTADARRSRLGPFGTVVAARPVAAFFALTLAISWGAWVPIAAGVATAGALAFWLTVVGVLGPPVAAGVVTWLVGDSLRAWVAPVARWRVRPRWYVVGLGLPAAVVAALALAHVALGTPLGEPPLVGQGPTVELPLVYAVHLVSLSVIGGGQEELGWRGFALPRLLDRVDATTASLVVGTVWAVWHLPLFAMGDTVQSGTAFVPYLVTTLGISVVLTWLYRGARRSVLLAVLFHGSLNASGLLSPVGEASGGLQWLEPVVWSLLAIALVVVHGRRLQSGEAVDGDRGERR